MHWGRGGSTQLGPEGQGGGVDEQAPVLGRGGLHPGELCLSPSTWEWRELGKAQESPLRWQPVLQVGLRRPQRQRRMARARRDWGVQCSRRPSEPSLPQAWDEAASSRDSSDGLSLECAWLTQSVFQKKLREPLRHHSPHQGPCPIPTWPARGLGLALPVPHWSPLHVQVLGITGWSHCLQPQSARTGQAPMPPIPLLISTPTLRRGSFQVTSF